MDLTIRHAGPSDAATIYDFIVKLAIYEREPDAVTYAPTRLVEQMRQKPPPFSCLIAESGGEALGFALYFFTYSTWEGQATLYLEDFFVDDSSRGHGVGYALFRRLASIALERQCRRMDWAVLRWNQLAIDFYERLGATEEDEFVGYRLRGEALRRLAE